MKIYGKTAKKIAQEKNLVVQINQHAPDGYTGAYSVGIQKGKEEMIFYSLPNYVADAKHALINHLKSI